ncbi:MAG: type II toxin-antitoxin system prevent-host-death family antitoxin [Actinomycetota bacterium]|nr:type II toxin-antitoxin system prevent-host-death family antitoxin [Actinomycetota bacterium]
MADRVIAQRELRNDIGRVLRAAEAGESFTVTVRGRPVARLVPPHDAGIPRRDVDRATIEAILALPIDGDDLAAELAAAEAPIDIGVDP